MKRTLLSTLALILATYSFSQVAWVEKDVALYEGCEFVVKAKKDSVGRAQGYKGFWKWAPVFDYIVPTSTNKVFSNGQGGSFYDSLVGMRFKCEKAMSAQKDAAGDYYFLKLSSPKVAEAYYLFNANMPQYFELELVGDVKIPADYFCTRIDLEEDQFDRTKTFSSPALERVSFSKYIEKGKAYYFLRLVAYGATSSFGKGVTIILSNGERISRPTEPNSVDVDSGGYGYEHSAFISLTASDLAKLQKYPISAFKIYIYKEEDIPGRKYQEFLKCLIAKK